MADASYIVDGVLTEPEAWVALTTELPDGSAGTVGFASGTAGSVTDWSQYQHLVAIGYSRSDTTAETDTYVHADINSEAGAYWSYQYMDVLNNASHAGGTVNHTYGFLSQQPTDSISDTEVFGVWVAYFFDINSGKFKNIHARGGYKSGTLDGFSGFNGACWCFADVGSDWSTVSQEAITEIDFMTTNGDWKSGSRIDLFGILPRMIQ
jgi:hypothetical protein